VFDSLSDQIGVEVVGFLTQVVVESVFSLTLTVIRGESPPVHRPVNVGSVDRPTVEATVRWCRSKHRAYEREMADLPETAERSVLGDGLTG
jgi:hypothetical protein